MQYSLTSLSKHMIFRNLLGDYKKIINFCLSIIIIALNKKSYPWS